MTTPQNVEPKEMDIPELPGVALQAARSTAHRLDLPTKDQLALITDVEALEDLRDDIERAIVKIETDLEFREADDEWAFRARNALALHRYAERIVGQRIRSLDASQNERSRSDCHPLALELLDSVETVDVSAIETLAEAEQRLATLVPQIDALKDDVSDEMATYTPPERDWTWIGRANAVLRRAGALRNELAKRAGDLRRAERIAEASRMMARARRTREQMFLDAAREVLDRDTYLMVWARVDHMEAALADGSPLAAKTGNSGMNPNDVQNLELKSR